MGLIYVSPVCTLPPTL